MDSSPSFLIRLLQLLRGHRLLMGMSVLFGLMFAGTTLIPPLLIRRLISWLTEGGGSSSGLLSITGSLVVVYAIRGICRYGYGRFSHVVAYRVMDELMVKVYRHLQTLSHRFYNKQRTGDLIARSINDIEAIEDFVAHGIPETVLALIVPLTMVIVLCTINAQLALIVILPLPLVSFLLFRYTTPVRQMWRKVRQGVAELVAQVQDNLSGMTEIKSFGQEQAQIEAVTRHSRHFRDASIRANNISLIPPGAVELAGGVGIVMAVWLGGGFALNGDMSVADLFVFIVYLSHIYHPFLQLASLTDVISKAAGSCERIFDLLDVEPDIKNKPNARSLSTVDGVIEFQNVSFAYQDNQPVVHNINFKVDAGEMVAIVGATGAGKTTLMGLIQRFYDPQHGVISLDGHDLRELDLNNVRKHITAVHQNVFLFHGTVRQNILFGKPDASETALIAATQAASAEAFILDMPQGYDTIIGERGVRLSGGQKQRISIARALLKNSPILLLDEATSAVDGQTEWAIQEALAKLIAQRTTLVIAHRLSTIANADRIIVLDQGRIVEVGSHATLMALEGHYAKMVQTQNMAQRWQFHSIASKPDDTLELVRPVNGI
ncbi:MAG: ABC transporter ATP-binding protein [Chloroflexota bacterium]